VSDKQEKIISQATGQLHKWFQRVFPYCRESTIQRSNNVKNTLLTIRRSTINFFCSLIIASVKLQPQPTDYTVLHTMFFFPRLPHARKLLTFCAAMLNLLFLKSWAALASTTFLAANLLRRRCDWFYTDRQLSPGDSWHVWDVGWLRPVINHWLHHVVRNGKHERTSFARLFSFPLYGWVINQTTEAFRQAASMRKKKSLIGRRLIDLAHV